MEITCYRDQALAQEPHQLPAAVYNLAHTLLERSSSGNLFIPIRTMQYLAILDAEELIFLDGARKCWIDIAWRRFHPQARSSLSEPVAYTAVYYTENAEKLMPRLQSALAPALQELSRKTTPDGLAKVLKFPAPARS
jgi:hypothetical protein